MPEERTETPKGVAHEMSATSEITISTAEIATEAEKAREYAQIEAQVVIAKRFPRSYDTAIQQIRQTCKRKDFAPRASWSYPRAQKMITGPSVWLARTMAAAWGNISLGFRVTRDDGEMIHVEAWAWDLESNARFVESASFANLIKRGGRWIKPDERDKRELVNKHGAVAVRNCIFACIPWDVTADAARVAAETAASNAPDPEIRRREMLTVFGEIGVTIAQLEAFLGKQRGGDEKPVPLKNITADEYVTLRGVYQSILEGNSTVNDYFRTGESDGDSGELKTEAGKAEDHAGRAAAPKPKANNGGELFPKEKGQ